VDLTEIDFVLGISTFIIMIVILAMVMVYGVFIKKKSELLLSQQKKEARFEQELATSQVEIKEQTLNYIGQELHDDLGQKLSVARLMTNKINMAEDGEREDIVQEINMLLGECIQDIRNLSKVFISTQVRRMGFVEALEREIFRIERLNLMQVDYRNNNHEPQIAREHELILFRIVQECITNVIKHSRSNKMKITIEDKLEEMVITVVDFGIGFSQKNVNDGSGLKNMKNRAKIINADFRLRSTANHGTEITLTYKREPLWNP